MPLLAVDAEREDHTMKIKSTLLAATIALTILAGSLAALVRQAGAQEPEATPAAARGERRTAFLERVAALLGVDLARLQQAIKDARLELIDEALANGHIDEGQAAQARERASNGQGFRRGKERRGRQERRAKIRAGIIEESAAAIGISADELKASLKAGNSIADEAAEHGVALEDVKASILDAAKTKLKAAVANGRIDQAKADEMLAKLESRLDDLLNKKRAAPATP
jgi:hypothetical protein